MDNQTTSTSPNKNGIGKKSATILAGTNLLLVLIYGSIFVLMIVLFVKRAILRVSFLSQQKNPAGNGSTKGTKARINKKLDETIDFAFEPRLMPDQTSDGEAIDQQGYIYRMKAVDAMNYIDDALSDASTELQRPDGKSVRAHLLAAKSHSSGSLKSIRTNQLQLFSDMYNQARFSPEPFTEPEFKRYMDLNSDIVTTLRHRTNKKKLKEKRLMRQNAMPTEKQNENDPDHHNTSVTYATTTLTESPHSAPPGSDVATGNLPSPGVADSQPLLNDGNS